MITLYWSPGTAAMAPQACLEEAGADYEMVRVRRDGYTVIEPEGYLALQPEGRIPALRDGDLVLHEAAAICMHIADRFPDSGLLPPVGTAERAHAYRWLTYLTNTLQATYQMWYQTDRFIQGEAVRAGVQRDLEPRLDEIFDWIDSQLETAGRTCSARRSRRPTSTASCSPAGAGTCPGRRGRCRRSASTTGGWPSGRAWSRCSRSRASKPCRREQRGGPRAPPVDLHGLPRGGRARGRRRDPQLHGAREDLRHAPPPRGSLVDVVQGAARHPGRARRDEPGAVLRAAVRRTPRLGRRMA